MEEGFVSPSLFPPPQTRPLCLETEEEEEEMGRRRGERDHADGIRTELSQDRIGKKKTHSAAKTTFVLL